MTTLFTELEQFIAWRNQIPKHLTIGFVPTMGALHHGHQSLIDRARAECDVVIVSIYVNALQFNSASDYANYPRTEDNDVMLCTAGCVNAIFAPLKHDVFSEETIVPLVPPSDSEKFEGADRPGHFAGVVTVVDRLFVIVRPTTAYFGLKDYQQVVVISKMSTQLHPQIKICACETMRDVDELALSSRNRFLTVAGRKRAIQLPIALGEAVVMWRMGTSHSQTLIDDVLKVLSEAHNIKVQYVSIVRAGTMETVEIVRDSDIIIAAIVVDGIRLIDNMSFTNA